MAITDPVCKMVFEENEAESTSIYKGETYYFCSLKCKERFDKNPELFLEKINKGSSERPSLKSMGGEEEKERPCPSCDKISGPVAVLKTKPGLIWTCPMHPEIESHTPGFCPKCGMALEPKSLLVEEENPELKDMRRRFWISLGFLVPLLILAMGPMISGLSAFFSSNVPHSSKKWFELFFSTPIVLWGGYPFFVRGFQSLKNRNWNMFTLIALGVGVAYLYSLIGAIFPQIFPPSLRMEGEVGLYFEAAAGIVTLVLLGQFLELKARNKTGNAIRELLRLSPKTARRVKNDLEEEVPLEEVRPGDLLRVRPGDRVPVDGLVVEGTSYLDESMITGEPIPVLKNPGDQIIGGTLNQRGTLVFRAEKVGDETLLSQIVRLVAEAQRSKAPIQKLADVVSGHFVKGVLLTSLLTLLGWSFFGPQPRIVMGIINAVAVLIVACPCALGLATPMSIMVAMGKGASAGILFKNAESIELMEKVDTLVIDKTGTITLGKPKVVKIITGAGYDESTILFYAGSVERASEHPIGEAIWKMAEERELYLFPVNDFQSITGKGVSGKVGGKEILLGNLEIMKEKGIDPKMVNTFGEDFSEMGNPVVFLSVDEMLAGAIVVSDPIKETSLEAIRALKKEGLKVVMVTGDNPKTAKKVSEKVQIEEFYGGVLPDQKAEIVKGLQKKGRIVAMAGDGINDAPALAQANVGIAMGTGTDVAIESAGITLVKGDLNGILRARRLSKAAMRNIKQNLFWAFLYNTLGIPIAAGLLYPLFGILLSPVIAAAAMSFSSLSVVANSLRLRKVSL